jgi:hypothetical protein
MVSSIRPRLLSMHTAGRVSFIHSPFKRPKFAKKQRNTMPVLYIREAAEATENDNADVGFTTGYKTGESPLRMER